MIQKTVKRERVFINSYTMSQPGDNDVQFRVDLGRVHNNVFKVEAQQLVVENKFLNMYDSQRGNFRDLSLTFEGVLYTITVDQYLTMDNLSSLIQSKTGTNFNIKFDNGTIYADPGSRIQFSATNGQQITFNGFGWSKLGFVLDTVQTFSGLGKVTASFLPDFGQPPLIFIRVQKFESQ